MLPLPSQTELQETFEFEAHTGNLIWKFRPLGSKKWNSKHAGKIAGSKNSKGYINVHFGAKIYCAHRIVFKIIHGTEPPAVIDHINCDGADNRPQNLRAATISTNGMNSRQRRKDLPKGVRVTPAGNYYADIVKNGEHHYLGTFGKDFEAAHKAYCAAAARLHGEFARFK